MNVVSIEKSHQSVNAHCCFSKKKAVEKIEPCIISDITTPIFSQSLLVLERFFLSTPKTWKVLLTIVGKSGLHI